MNIAALSTAVSTALITTAATGQTSIHLRIYGQESCTITNESQCNGQNWTGSTCCADPSYECRNSDDGQNVQRCQKKRDTSTSTGNSADDNSSDDSSSDETVYLSYVADWADCTSGDVGCSNPTSYCVVHSSSYAQCKPATLPPGELCGQNDGTNVWYYPYCISEEICKPNGSDHRCTKAKKRHHHRHHRA